MTIVTAAILVIGDEVLSGRTQDANTQALAQALGDAGVTLRESRAIADDEDTIIAALNDLRPRYDYVFTSGGIGPTHDDITAEAVGKAFGTRVTIRDDARALLEAHYGDQINDARLRMARIPDGAHLIPNPISIAPGFRIENVFVMAGIPRIFAVMLEAVVPTLKSGAVVREVSFACDRGEGALSAPLADIATKHPAVSIGSYPRIKVGGGFEVTIVARSTDAAALEAAENDLRKMLADMP